MTAELTDPDVLSRVGQKFVQGRRGLWVPEIPGKRLGHYPCVRINSNSAYAKLGLILVDCQNRIINDHNALHYSKNSPVIVPLDRTDFSFEKRAFMTYSSDAVSKPTKKDDHLLVYAPA